MILKNQVAIITGASRGIGKEIALTFAKEGARVVLCATNRERLSQAAQQIETESGVKPLFFTFDIREAKEMSEVVKKTLDTHTRIDILVNNAGITRDQLLVMMPEEDWDAVLCVNLKSVFLFTKAVAKAMIRQRSGRIINVSSVIGITGNAGQANYAASKGGIIAFTKSAAQELGKRNITVNAIAPGFIETDMTAPLENQAKEDVRKRIPLGRLGVPNDVAQVALFLASKQSSYITGQVIRVDGGINM
ncbi:MAG: 3-oxoacyl-[acyl-carrier-protein] reductase [Omnitrophica bacterium RIFCSPLOWO2_12_FULL_50_11]|nr:MAG: 3-oxoacyl-[acyl-carrier-protein] reductase [Omnitrophica bacterium RIFCSPLOWO2_12_FULL_50_11]